MSLMPLIQGNTIHGLGEVQCSSRMEGFWDFWSLSYSVFHLEILEQTNSKSSERQISGTSSKRSLPEFTEGGPRGSEPKDSKGTFTCIKEPSQNPQQLPVGLIQVPNGQITKLNNSVMSLTSIIQGKQSMDWGIQAHTSSETLFQKNVRQERVLFRSGNMEAGHDWLGVRDFF